MGKKVLLAEDSLTIQKVFELTFRGSDIALTMVDNGEDAVRLAGEIAPDLVMADVTLPGKDGFEVAASLGVRPTVADRGEPLLEVFILDFDHVIYGRRVTVEFLHKLRDEERYADLDALARQIRADVAEARAYFAGARNVLLAAPR